MIARVHDERGLWPRKLIGDTGYGSADMLGWLVNERDIEQHIPAFDKSARIDGAFDRTDFVFEREMDHYTCPAGKQLRRFRRTGHVDHDRPNADGFYRYRASWLDCDACSFRPQCCPGADARKIMRSVHEGARVIAQKDEWITSRRERKKVELLFAHLKRSRQTRTMHGHPSV